MFEVAHASDQSTWQVTNVTRVELSSKSDQSSPLEFGGLGWGSQNVEAPNLKLPTKWFLIFFDEKHLKTIV